MCCCCRCCKCCSRALKIACGVIWGVIALALVICIIIICVAWGGSKAAQNIVKYFIDCSGDSKTSQDCENNFGTYITKISEEKHFDLSCIEFNENNEIEEQFGWKINFDPNEKNKLGVYASISKKGNENDPDPHKIFQLLGTVDTGVSGSEDIYENNYIEDNYIKDAPSNQSEIFIVVKENTHDKEDNPVNDPSKRYIVHNEYVRINAYGNCGNGGCPEPLGDEYEIAVKSGLIHVKVTFKSVPKFINITIDDENINYEKMIDDICKVVKVFSKDLASSIKDFAGTLVVKVRGFDDGVKCPISPKYDPEA